jgi:hypothetical protein
MNNLVETMVNNIENKTIHIDVILSGGAFNAIYLIGCLYFLKEMERKNKIIIHRMSTCSASSFVALFYLTNNLELFEKVYNMIVHNFKRNKKYIFSNEDVVTVFNLIETTLYDENGLTEYEILKKVNYKLYITYFDIKKCKRVVKNKYKSLDDIFETIKKSAHIPFITMNYILYQNRYMDGWQPFIFTTNENKQLFIDLLGIDKIKECIVLKNNKKNKHKIINGLRDAYSFFYQNGKHPTAMCSYLNDNNNITFIMKFYSLYVFSYMLCMFLYLYVFFFRVPSYTIIHIYPVRMFLQTVKRIFYYFIEHYCL